MSDIPIRSHVPEGCEPIPGYIVECRNGTGWLTKDGSVTQVWQERGVWATPELAADAAERFTAE